MIGGGGGSTTILIVLQIRFILLSILRTIIFVDPPLQVHPYVLPLHVLQKLAASWFFGALLLHAAP